MDNKNNTNRSSFDRERFFKELGAMGTGLGIGALAAIAAGGCAYLGLGDFESAVRESQVAIGDALNNIQPAYSALNDAVAGAVSKFYNGAKIVVPGIGAGALGYWAGDKFSRKLSED